MARRDTPCSACGRPMWSGPGSLPTGQATCRPCRRKAPGFKPQWSPASRHVPEQRFCRICDEPFETKRASQVYCSPECRSRRNNWGKQGDAVNPKYRTKEHRALAAQYKTQINAGHVLECQAPECVMSTRAITNPNGMHEDGVTVGHNDDGVTYRGPEHRACNLLDAAKRGHQRSRVTAPRG